VEEHAGRGLVDANVANVKAALDKYINAGLLISISELDVGNGTDAQRAQKYADLFKLFKGYSSKGAEGNGGTRGIERVTFWGTAMPTRRRFM
jgi:GH35 family endo-1,4-beta-xylanase